LIRWILLLQEFDLEIKDKKIVENPIADHLSRMQFENSQELPINDLLRDDMLFKVTKSDPWYVNIVNFMVAGHVPPGENKRKLIYESRLHIWDPSYLFRVCADGLLRRCVPTEEGIQIIQKCHSSPYGGHYGVSILMRRFSRVDSFGQPYMKTLEISSDDAEHVRGIGILIQEMPCHSPKTFRLSSLMSGESITWDHFQSQRIASTS
jgi:hypothetical protein